MGNAATMATFTVLFAALGIVGTVVTRFFNKGPNSGQRIITTPTNKHQPERGTGRPKGRIAQV